ncbi:MAG: hypothetical protein ACHQD9_03150 [Chitinophagales bacterium]
MNSKDQDESRRRFLKTMLAAGAGIGFLSSISGTRKKNQDEKIKMLTADGRLVEVDRSQIKREITSGRATNEEVLEWMNSPKESFGSTLKPSKSERKAG